MSEPADLVVSREITRPENLRQRYRDYLDCLNRRAWNELGRHVGPDVVHNDRRLGLDGYRRMLQADVEAIPDLVFTAELVSVQPPLVAARLLFDVHPRGLFLGLDVAGRRAEFSENVFYRYQDDRIVTVWSVVDKAALERALDS